MTETAPATVVDWSAKPAPWCWIGQQFRRECELIAGTLKPPPSVGKMIRRRRVALGLKQYELGIAAGYRSGDAVCKSERGSRKAAPRILAALDRIEAERAGATP